MKVKNCFGLKIFRSWKTPLDPPISRLSSLLSNEILGCKLNRLGCFVEHHQFHEMSKWTQYPLHRKKKIYITIRLETNAPTWGKTVLAFTRTSSYFPWNLDGDVLKVVGVVIPAYLMLGSSPIRFIVHSVINKDHTLKLKNKSNISMTITDRFIYKLQKRAARQRLTMHRILSVLLIEEWSEDFAGIDLRNLKSWINVNFMNRLVNYLVLNFSIFGRNWMYSNAPHSGRRSIPLVLILEWISNVRRSSELEDLQYI